MPYGISRKKGKKDKRIIVRVSSKDFEVIKSRSLEKKISMSRYIREKTLSDIELPIKDSSFMNVQSDLIHEVNKIGVNLNQITKMFHSGYFIEADKKQILLLKERLEYIMEQNVKYMQKILEEGKNCEE